MQKAKLGISVGLLGAAIYLTALSGSLLGLLVLAGYVLMVEDNQWLRLSAVKAVAVYLFFTFVIQAVGYVPDGMDATVYYGSADFRFVGNIEAKHIFSGRIADVVVCDGFVGNTIIKQVEGVYNMALEQGLRNTYFNQLNYETVGGTPVLGINAPVLIGHGCSSAEAIKNMVLQTEKTIHAQLDTKLRERFS